MIAIPNAHAQTNPYQSNINAAVSYLESRYSPSIGLVSESEDLGLHWLSLTTELGSQWNPNWHYYNTYWTASDNLYALLALEPFNPILSQQINHTIQSYGIQEQGEFMTVTGTPIQQYRVVTDKILASTSDYVVLVRNYDGPVIKRP